MGLCSGTAWTVTWAMLRGSQQWGMPWGRRKECHHQHRCYLHSCRQTVGRLQPGAGQQHVAPPAAVDMAAPPPGPGGWMCASEAVCWTWVGPASPSLQLLPQLWAECSAPLPKTLGWNAPPPLHCSPVHRQCHLSSHSQTTAYQGR